MSPLAITGLVLAYLAVGAAVSGLLLRFGHGELAPSDAGGFAIVWPFVVLLLAFWLVFAVCGLAARRIAGPWA